MDGHESDKDAGWGLIYRLNNLWALVDSKILRGDYDGWELTIDRVFANLLYRNPMEVEYNDSQVPIDVEPNDDDIKEWEIMKEKIRRAKAERKSALIKRDKRSYSIAQDKYYKAILFYDIWTRKFMQKHSLYLKETQKDASNSLFGGAFNRRK